MSSPTRYRRVRVRIWLEPTFRALKERDRLVVLYLLTGPQTTAVGLYRLSPASAADDLGMKVGQFRRSLEIVLRAFGWRYEPTSSLVWIPEWIEENQPQNPNVVKAWRSAFDEIPDSALKVEAATSTLAFLKAKGEKFGEAFGEPFDRRVLESVQESLGEPVRNDSWNAPDPDPDRANRIANHDARRLANATDTRHTVSQLRQRGW